MKNFLFNTTVGVLSLLVTIIIVFFALLLLPLLSIIQEWGYEYLTSAVTNGNLEDDNFKLMAFLWYISTGVLYLVGIVYGTVKSLYTIDLVFNTNADNGK